MCQPFISQDVLFGFPWKPQVAPIPTPIVAPGTPKRSNAAMAPQKRQW